MIDDIIKDRAKDFSGTLDYDKNSFVVCREHDKFHPNTLTGYLTALCTYFAFTQKDVSLAEHGFVKAMSNEFYTLGESDHEQIIASAEDMKALKILVVDYCKKYNCL